jgi:glyoxalase family protein
MSRAIPGLHHVTAISGPPQANVDFYVGTMRQRLVKRTVNFDAPGTYHLYYGDPTGSPGTILTFFPFADAGPGRAGPGMAGAVAYRVPPGGLDAWMVRLAEDAIDFEGPSERFGERMIAVTDPDGLRVELIEVAGSSGAEGAPTDDGFHSVTLRLSDPAPTARVLTDLFGYEEAGRETTDGTERLRFRSPAGGRGSVVDLIRSGAPPIGRQGAGTIHHVAFRAETRAVQREWRERVAAFGLDVTPVIDRQYFDAIYFREPGGVLFEIATDPPGFATDEDEAELGRHLKLPPRYERQRAAIERVLPPIRVPG